jgi:hypothetical protein
MKAAVASQNGQALYENWYPLVRRRAGALQAAPLA